MRFLSAFHTHKARSLSTRLGPARPMGTRRGDGRSLVQANRRSDSCPRFRKHILGLRLSAMPSDHAFRPRLSHAFQPRLSVTLSGHVFRRAIPVEDVVCTSKTTEETSQSYFRSSLRPQSWGYTQPHCADNHLTLLVQGLKSCRSLVQANRRSSALRPRFGKHVLGLRFQPRLSDHAFSHAFPTTPFSHAFQPRLSATPSGHVLRRAIRIEDVVLCHSNVSSGWGSPSHL